MPYANAAERPVSQALSDTLSIRNSEMRTEMDANMTVGSLLKFVSRVDVNGFDRHILQRTLEECVREVESKDDDIRLHKFLSAALEYIRSR